MLPIPHHMLIDAKPHETRMPQMMDLRVILHLFFGCVSLSASNVVGPLMMI